ncbi:uncharacterized protein N7511_005953 [Penicillium nucicola]|uniref:uncharacterized protein n=1 Tax=Penicillium nucicola TaxID=1850975 RepID=UPI0025452476|nr:uncharacterized protein N7511_005953 [Penicillium nucicola]KAJ5762571.1 hypothetical protein N7511_005953 [Penicillium nucicola]
MDTKCDHFVRILRSQINNLRHYPGRRHNLERHDLQAPSFSSNHRPRIIEQLEEVHREVKELMTTTADAKPTNLQNLCASIMPVLPSLIRTLKSISIEDHKVAFDLERLLTHAEAVNVNNKNIGPTVVFLPF